MKLRTYFPVKRTGDVTLEENFGSTQTKSSTKARLISKFTTYFIK